MVASTFKPLTIGFPVILVGNREEDALPDIHPHLLNTRFATPEQTMPTEDTSSRNDDMKTQRMVIPLNMRQDDATLAYDDQGIGYAR